LGSITKCYRNAHPSSAAVQTHFKSMTAISTHESGSVQNPVKRRDPAK
jgi:hypothetical protein